MLKIQSDKNSNRNKPGTIEQQKKTWKREGNVARKYDSPKAHTPSIVRNKNPTSLSKFPKNSRKKEKTYVRVKKVNFTIMNPIPHLLWDIVLLVSGSVLYRGRMCNTSNEICYFYEKW